MKVVLDASVIIDYLRTKDQASPIIVLRPTHDFFLSLITVAELYSGASVHTSERERKVLESILSGIEVVLPTRDSAISVGTLRHRYQLSLGDGFVAALAIELEVPVLARDKKAFARVSEITLCSEKLPKSRSASGNA